MPSACFIKMYKYIIVLCLCVRLSGVLCDLNKKEGDECEWEGFKGKCVKETRCLSTLDEYSSKHPVCSRKGGESIICCTDCQLVDNTKNAVFSPTAGLYWKNGQKARDSCLQYIEELPYQCKQDGFYGGISRVLDEENNCFKHYDWAVEGESAKDTKPGAKYPYHALLGFGDDAETAQWGPGGFIISDKYIVTVAHDIPSEVPEIVAMGVNYVLESKSTWQIRKIKRIIFHPEFKHPVVNHDIALIETDTPIKFDKNVLPGCLHVDEDASVEDAVTTSWVKFKNHAVVPAKTIQTIKVKKFSEQECNAANVITLDHGYNHTTQMCYGSKSNMTDPTCTGWPGLPLMITTQFSSCVHTAIGMSAFWNRPFCGPKRRNPDGYTRIAPYVPWIESIVWP